MGEWMRCAYASCDQRLNLATAPDGHGWVALDWLGYGGVNPTGLDGPQTTAYLPLYFCRLLHVQQFLEALPDDVVLTAAAIPGRRYGYAPPSRHPALDVTPPDAWLIRDEAAGVGYLARDLEYKAGPGGTDGLCPADRA